MICRRSDYFFMLAVRKHSMSLAVFKKDVGKNLSELSRAVRAGAIKLGDRVTFAWSTSTLDENCMLVEFRFLQTPGGEPVMYIENIRGRCVRDEKLMAAFRSKIAAFARRHGLSLVEKNIRR